MNVSPSADRGSNVHSASTVSVLVKCPACSEVVNGLRFAPHLEKCLTGGGRSKTATVRYSDSAYSCDHMTKSSNSTSANPGSSSSSNGSNSNKHSKMLAAAGISTASAPKKPKSKTQRVDIAGGDTGVMSALDMETWGSGGPKSKRTKLGSKGKALLTVGTSLNTGVTAADTAEYHYVLGLGVSGSADIGTSKTSGGESRELSKYMRRKLLLLQLKSLETELGVTSSLGDIDINSNHSDLVIDVIAKRPTPKLNRDGTARGALLGPIDGGLLLSDVDAFSLDMDQFTTAVEDDSNVDPRCEEIMKIKEQLAQTIRCKATKTPKLPKAPQYGGVDRKIPSKMSWGLIERCIGDFTGALDPPSESALLEPELSLVGEINANVLGLSEEKPTASLSSTPAATEPSTESGEAAATNQHPETGPIIVSIRMKNRKPCAHQERKLVPDTYFDATVEQIAAFQKLVQLRRDQQAERAERAQQARVQQTAAANLSQAQFQAQYLSNAQTLLKNQQQSKQQRQQGTSLLVNQYGQTNQQYDASLNGNSSSGTTPAAVGYINYGLLSREKIAHMQHPSGQAPPQANMHQRVAQPQGQSVVGCTVNSTGGAGVGGLTAAQMQGMTPDQRNLLLMRQKQLLTMTRYVNAGAGVNHTALNMPANSIPSASKNTLSPPGVGLAVATSGEYLLPSAFATGTPTQQPQYHLSPQRAVVSGLSGGGSPVPSSSPGQLPSVGLLLSQQPQPQHTQQPPGQLPLTSQQQQHLQQQFLLTPQGQRLLMARQAAGLVPSGHGVATTGSTSVSVGADGAQLSQQQIQQLQLQQRQQFQLLQQQQQRATQSQGPGPGPGQANLTQAEIQYQQRLLQQRQLVVQQGAQRAQLVPTAINGGAVSAAGIGSMSVPTGTATAQQRVGARPGTGGIRSSATAGTTDSGTGTPAGTAGTGLAPQQLQQLQYQHLLALQAQSQNNTGAPRQFTSTQQNQAFLQYAQFQKRERTLQNSIAPMLSDGQNISSSTNPTLPNPNTTSAAALIPAVSSVAGTATNRSSATKTG